MTWAQELRAIIAATDEATQLLHLLRAWTWDSVVAEDVLPRQLPEAADRLFESLRQQLAGAREAASAAFGRYSSGPVERLFTKRPLSREDYFLLLALGGRLKTGHSWTLQNRPPRA
jgi:hypothetical protein